MEDWCCNEDNNVYPKEKELLNSFPLTSNSADMSSEIEPLNDELESLLGDWGLKHLLPEFISKLMVSKNARTAN